MLLEFRLGNFRSFRRENAISMIASRDKELIEENTMLTGIPLAPRALRAAAIYGANASGKTNFLRGLRFMQGVVLGSASLQPGQTYNFQTFHLDKASTGEPAFFEVTVMIDGVRYQYGFQMMPDRITREWLLVYEKAKAQHWFRRYPSKTEGKETFRFSTHFRGPKKIWQDATLPNALFLSRAVQLNSQQLQPLYGWFSKLLTVLVNGPEISRDFSTGLIQDHANHKRIVSLLEAADMGIQKISAEKKPSVLVNFRIDATASKTDTETATTEIQVPKFTHVVGDVSAIMDVEDESRGTMKLFALAGPLLDIMATGKLFVIDELDSSLHPLLVRRIVEGFQDSRNNKHGAQLIFTTHDSSLLNSGILRRDQIWLTEKGGDQASELTPLSDFSPRKGESLERGYLSGRYGGVPILSEKIAVPSLG